MSLSIGIGTGNYVSKGTLGITRSRTNKFMELRKKHIEENSMNKFDTGSSLNDTGKTR
jgi:hypothetical protein